MYKGEIISLRTSFFSDQWLTLTACHERKIIISFYCLRSLVNNLIDETSVETLVLIKQAKNWSNLLNFCWNDDTYNHILIFVDQFPFNIDFYLRILNLFLSFWKTKRSFELPLDMTSKLVMLLSIHSSSPYESDKQAHLSNHLNLVDWMASRYPLRYRVQQLTLSCIDRQKLMIKFIN